MKQDNKNLEFSVNQITINDKRARLEDFEKLLSSDLDVTKIGVKDKEVIFAKKTEKMILDNRFVCIYSEEGSKYPYPVKVYDSLKNKEVDNPRDVNQIELMSQLFLVIDTSTSRLYVSDQRKRNQAIGWLEKVTGKVVQTKAILKEQDFVKNIQSLKEITFSVDKPNLFNTIEGTLSSELVKDMNGFGAEEAVLIFKYKKYALTEELKRKVNDLIGRRSQFKDLTIVGRTDDHINSVLNLDGVTNKISIEIEPDHTTKKFDKEIVFDSLVYIIKKSDDTKIL